MTVLVSVFLSSLSGAGELNTRQVDAVYAKSAGGGILDSSDFAIIDDFVKDSVEQMILCEDLPESVKIRSQIFASSHSGVSDQYSVSFATSAAKHLTAAFESLDQWPAGLRRKQARRNIIVLAGRLESIELVRLGLRAIDSDDLSVRYWAVICVTNDSVSSQLVSDEIGNAELTTEIVTRLKAMSHVTVEPEIQFLISVFADRLGGNDGAGLLTAVSQVRLKAYENWTVEYALADAKILKCLGRAIVLADTAEGKSNLSRSFAQLYSYVIQRYILGYEILEKSDISQLASVIVDVEQGAIGKLLGSRQSAMQTAIEKKKPSALQTEHDFLFGSATRRGSLPEKLNFDYGTDPSGKSIDSPKRLSEPPKKADPDMP
jgi:hypothetical protein